ncbi:membrane-associated protein, putative [Bodo saltans]|uniref:Membrane-associated protein, putative n=1 Tax=Bodo saltans TaxID=75058 RepID=A0A0S4KGI7_BODSA|nr:membrane-associated protein, putative [Bodo saltans]|eukprot:CUI14245.1 membrane-associated protein, putative [Bodo saltans]
MSVVRTVALCMMAVVLLASVCVADNTTTTTAAPNTTTTIAPNTTTSAPNTTTMAPDTTTTAAPPSTTAAPSGFAPDLPYTEDQKFGISCATFACLAVAWALFCFIYGKIADRCSPEAEGPKYAQLPQANKI